MTPIILKLHRRVLAEQIIRSIRIQQENPKTVDKIFLSVARYRESKGMDFVGRDTISRQIKRMYDEGSLARVSRNKKNGKWEYWYSVVKK